MNKALIIIYLVFLNNFVYSQIGLNIISDFKISKRCGIYGEIKMINIKNKAIGVSDEFNLGGLRYFKDSISYIGLGIYGKTIDSSISFFEKIFYPERYSFTNVERGIWQQVFYSWHINSKNDILTRIRLNQGWNNQTSIKLKIGLSLFPRYEYSLVKMDSTINLVFVLQNELKTVLYSTNKNHKFFDENQMYIGIGIKNNNKFRLDLGYLNIYKINADKRNGHAIQLNLFTSIVFCQNDWFQKTKNKE